MCSSCPPVLGQFWRPSPSQVQVKSKSGRIRKSHPAWPQISLLVFSPPPAPISFPAHHQGEPNSPGFFFPFDQRRPESWLILTAWRSPSAELNSQGAYCAYLDTLNPPYGLLHSPLLAAAATTWVPSTLSSSHSSSSSSSFFSLSS